MKPFVYEISEFVCTALPSLTFATNFWVGELPQGKSGIYANTTAGVPPERYSPVENHVISFVAVNENEGQAFDDLREIMYLLDRKLDYDTEHYHIFVSLLNSTINDLDRDSEGRKVLQLNVQFIVRDINLIS